MQNKCCIYANSGLSFTYECRSTDGSVKNKSFVEKVRYTQQRFAVNSETNEYVATLNADTHGFLNYGNEIWINRVKCRVAGIEIVEYVDPEDGDIIKVPVYHHYRPATLRGNT